MKPLIDLRSARAKQARLGHFIGKTGFQLLLGLGSLWLVAAAATGLIIGLRWALLLAPLALICLLLAVWWRLELSVLPASGTTLAERLSGDLLARLKPDAAQQPRSLWSAIQGHWQAIFFLNHLLISEDLVAEQLSDNPADLEKSLQTAIKLADQNHNQLVDVGFVVAGLMLTSAAMQQTLIRFKIQPSDVEAIANWLGRNLAQAELSDRSFGGIGRDWAFGYTPLLDRLGHNISLAITDHGAHFGWLTNSDGVLAIEAAFDNHARAVALIGPDGIGKSTSVYALAQRLIEGRSGPTLAYHQVISLNATDITSNAKGMGDLEEIMLSLIGEATQAGHIVLFFDDAQLFFSDRPGSFDATQILLSAIQASPAPMILAMSPDDFQRLKTRNLSLANLLTPVVLQELPETGVMRVLEDIAAGLETKNHVLVTYEALHEAYRLSGRYDQEQAYPGKAIKLLEMSVSHSEHSLVNAVSVQQAVEQARGVKVGTAKPAEAEALLHLEDNIHRRMINQSHAVSVVSAALRRARAGVANPKRPIGSFLFLGPTGVGKTELAKAIAATYFGAETNMVRLDMSEYQRPEDVSRLLSNGQTETKSLIMAVREQPFSVVLLDEIEKAHANILNLLLQLLDEGQLTDTGGRPVSFKDCVIIATSNAGATTIRDRVAAGQTLESFQDQFVDELINSDQFKPELINRFDEIVLFRPLKPEELAQVVNLMLAEINLTLANQNVAVELTPAGVQAVVAAGYDPRLGARPMRRTLQRAVEDTVAKRLLRGDLQPGDKLLLDAPDLNLADQSSDGLAGHHAS